jgi:DNA end-binding protein Ku
MGSELGNDVAMPRSIWKGALNFGLVNVPVGLYSATQDKTIHFNQFEEGTSDRIRYKKVNERTGKEVPAGKIVKGFDLGGGEYVILSEEELESAEPKKSHLIEITDFVDLDQIDPVYYRSTYYLAPEGEAANKAYALLRQVMRAANKVAIGTVVMRNKEYPVAIRPDDNVLALETMYFADEIRSPTKDLPELPAADEVSDRELKMAGLLLESMESDWDPEKYHDTHREKVEAVIEAKRQGDEIVTGVEAAPPSTKVVDLMDVLSASIESVDARRKNRSTQALAEDTDGAVAPAKRPATKRAAAKRPTPIKKANATAKAKPAAKRKAS